MFEAFHPCGEVSCALCLSGVAVLLDPLADQHTWADMLGGGAAPDPSSSNGLGQPVPRW